MLFLGISHRRHSKNIKRFVILLTYLLSTNEYLAHVTQSMYLNHAAMLANAQQSIRQDIATERIRPKDFIERDPANQKHGLTGDERKRIFESVEHISYNDLKEFHDRELKDKPFTYCIMGSDKKISEKDLENYGAVKK